MTTPGDTAVDSRPFRKLVGQSQDNGRRALSLAQRRVYDAICAYVADRGIPPTVRDIRRLSGLASTSTVAYHLHVLADWGYIRRDPARSRSIVVLRTPQRQEADDVRYWLTLEGYAVLSRLDAETAG